MFAIRTIIILFFVFCSNVFIHAYENRCFFITPFSEEERSMLDDKYKNIRKYKRNGFVANCEDSLSNKYTEVDPRPCGMLDDNTGGALYNSSGEVFKDEEFTIYTYDDSSKIIRKWISCGGVLERFETKYDSNGNLTLSEREIRKFRKPLSFRVEVWNKGKLVRTKYNNINRSIVEKKPCLLEIIEPKGNSTFLHLDPEKEPPVLVQKDVIDSAEVYDVIKYHWYPHCKAYHETQKSIKTSNDTASIISATEKEPAMPYKYYAIIVIFIVAASVLIIHKKRKGNEK
ncbi:MAG: hypothetical protein LBU89_01685 [Fibromonadaceae bacterium]|jgi:hypothetical protein|nr:hypothetical protein [Fibromonadaceae bacterium]